MGDTEDNRDDDKQGCGVPPICIGPALQASKGPDYQLFVQMNKLRYFNDGDTDWREMARWVKYEERVEQAKRWSKPYVATLSLHALYELRQGLGSASIQLNTNYNDIQAMASGVSQNIADKYGLDAAAKQKINYLLLRPHKHQHVKGIKKPPFEGNLVDENDEPGDFPFPKLPLTGAVPSPSERPGEQPNKKFKKKLSKKTEAANILVGEVDFLKSPVYGFIRQTEAKVFGDMTEISAPTKFLFVLLGPPQHHSVWDYDEVGRAAATLLTDKMFRASAMNADKPEELVQGVNEYIDDLTVLPPALWDPSTRLAPENAKAGKASEVRARRRAAAKGEDFIPDEPPHKEDDSLVRTGRIFGGLVRDIKRKIRYYPSDFYDAISIQGLATVFFIYFACITPIVTFGGLLGDATDQYMGTMECIVSGAMSGLLYHFFAGQPLTIVGATGPLLVYESLVYKLCKTYGFDFLPWRCWIGIWSAIMLMLICMFDLSVVVKKITRFTEESFSVLISLIFIAEAIKSCLKISYKKPIMRNTDEQKPSCYCLPWPCWRENQTSCIGDNMTAWTSIYTRDCVNMDNKVLINHFCASEKSCEYYGGNVTGPGCYNYEVTHSTPDVFLLSVILMLMVFFVAMALNLFRNMRFFPKIVRSVVADFAVVIAIVCATGLDTYLGLGTPKLNVPAEFKTTNPNRKSWFINPGSVNHGWLIPLALVPAILAVILIFLDQQITAVIVNRKENKLKKGHGYHMDMFVLSIIILLTSLLGLPWFVAATVRSMIHVRSLMMQSESQLPGDKPDFLGVREQRLTGIIIHILIAVSIFFTPVLRLIPMPVLYGVFMYMGFASLRNVQFVQRVLIIFMPKKYQPDYIYLRHVKTYRVHIFTVVQVLCMAAMWAVKSVKAIAIGFPLLVLALCIVRAVMSKFFSPMELHWLDDLEDESTRRKMEDKRRLKNGGEFETNVDTAYDKPEIGLNDVVTTPSSTNWKEKEANAPSTFSKNGDSFRRPLLSSSSTTR